MRVEGGHSVVLVAVTPLRLLAGLNEVRVLIWGEGIVASRLVILPSLGEPRHYVVGEVVLRLWHSVLVACSLDHQLHLACIFARVVQLHQLYMGMALPCCSVGLFLYLDMSRVP